MTRAGWIHASYLAVWLLGVLAAYSQPVTDFRLEALLAIGIAPPALFWSVFAIAWPVRRMLRRSREGEPTLRSAALFFATIAIAVASVRTGAPLKARFALSEPALRRVAEAALRGESRTGLAGLYVVRRTTVSDGRVHLETASGFVFAVGGFCYAPGASFDGGWPYRYDAVRSDWASYVERD